ncbi:MULTISPECIES: hypothetical protein [Pseudomonas]|jgi:hypothetical protein|uniref:hypothetical protein n=1 Tax=Pseudomonas TaxID=286 RepID=UPI0011147B32|nr:MULTISPECIES: hypothetical protein [Pseudomonas]
MMNLYRLLFVGFLVISGCASVDSSMQADMPKGSIKLSANVDGSGKSCILGIKETTGWQDFELGDTNCSNDEARYFALDNVPSATQIRFDGIPCKSDRNQWSFKIKTIVQPTTTRRINLRELQTAVLGSIVVRGVMYIENNRPGEYNDGKLSCVKVLRSALP